MTKTAFSRAALCAGIAACTLTAPGLAFAQEAEEELAGPPDDEFEQDAGFSTGNEIVVTATKREQTLQEIPVAVSVTSAETLDRAQIRDLKDLQTEVPSLRINTLQSSANTNFIIRGFGNGANNAGIEPSVGVFVDGVYRSRTGAAIGDLPNVQRIEVLRGPQSTLFGKNASAGVISLVTREPQFTFGGSLEASYGNLDQIIVKGDITGPLSDNVAASIAAGYNSRDGYIYDANLDTDVNNRNRGYVRGQLLAEPTSELTIRIIGDYDWLDENCCGVVNLQSAAPTFAIQALGGQVTDPSTPFADVVFNNYESSNDIENYGISGQIDYDIGPLTLTSITAFRRSNSMTDQDSDFTSADLIGRNFADLEIETFTQELRASFEFADFASALLGVYYFDESVRQENEIFYGTQFRPYADFLIQAATDGAFSVDLLEGTFGALEGDPGRYIGAFFEPGTGLDEAVRLDNDAFSVFGQLDVELAYGLTLTLGGNYTVDNKSFGLDILSNDTFSGIDFNNPAYSPFRQQSLLLLGLQQAGVDISDPLAINAFATGAQTAPIYQGIVAFAAANADNPLANPLNALEPLQFLPPFLNLPNSVEDGEIDDDNFSYTVRLAYDVSPDLNVYASYATGFKASSVNLSRDSRPLASDAAALGAAGLTVVNQSFGTRFAGPEESKVWEIGAKLNVPTFSANLALFDQTIEGFQSNIFTGTGFALANAGEQSTKGAEFDFLWTPVRQFSLNGAVTYLDPIYDSFVNSAFGDASGFRPAGIPEWNFTIGGQFEHEFDNYDRIIARISYYHESEVQIAEGLPAFIVEDQLGNPIDFQPAFDAAAPFTREVNEVTASITYASDLGLDVTFWGRNLFDDRYVTTIFDSVAQDEAISGYTNQPRTYGVTLKYKFGSSR